jgi:hypothetical protein
MKKYLKYASHPGFAHPVEVPLLSNGAESPLGLFLGPLLIDRDGMG